MLDNTTVKERSREAVHGKTLTAKHTASHNGPQRRPTDTIFHLEKVKDNSILNEYFKEFWPTAPALAVVIVVRGGHLLHSHPSPLIGFQRDDHDLDMNFHLLFMLRVRGINRRPSGSLVLFPVPFTTCGSLAGVPSS